MSERTVPDDVLESMLAHRAGAGAPPGLRREIVNAAMTDTAAPIAADDRARRRVVTPLRLLGVAAVIGALGGAILIAGGVRRPEDPLRDAVVPPLPTAVSSPSTTPTHAPTPRPTTAPRSPEPTDDLTPGHVCDLLDQITSPIRPDPSFAGVPGRHANGDLLVAPDDTNGEALTLDRLTITGSQSTILELSPGVSLDDWLRLSPDGALVAFSVRGADIGSWCGEPVLLASLADGVVARPFEVAAREAVSLPTWSPDGSTLYSVHETIDLSDPVDEPQDPGTVLAWDRRTGTVTNLGSPCPDCRVVALFPSREAGRLVADVCDTGCSSNHSIRTRKIAVLDGGRWHVVVDDLAGAFGYEYGVPETLGLTNGFRLVIGLDNVVGTLSLGKSAAAAHYPATSCRIARSALSPDGSTVAAIIDDGATRLGLLDLASGTWTNGSAGTAVGVCPSPFSDAPQVNWSAPVWSPDLTRVAIRVPVGELTQIRIVLLDGTSVVDLPVRQPGTAAGEGPFAGTNVLAWLPAAP